MVRRGRDAETDTGSNEGPQGVMDLIKGMAEAMREQAEAMREQAEAMREQAEAMREQVAEAMREQAEAVREQVAVTTQFVRQMQEQGENNNRNHEGHIGNPDFKGWIDFLESSPPSFKGEFDPKKAAEWLEEMEKLFEVFGNSDAQKVSFGTYMLKGNAEHWWNGAKKLLEARGTILTWDTFKEAFLERYFPMYVRKQKEVEFVCIKQGDTPFEKFLAEYEDLAKHSSYLRANDEEWQCMHFVSALNPKLKSMVAQVEVKNFATLVNMCRLCNDGMAELEKGIQQSSSFKRKQSGFGKGSEGKVNKNDAGKKPKTGQAFGGNCPKCGKMHGNRPCLAGQGVCFKCGKPGHYARDCSQAQKSVEAPKPQTMGRVYTLKGKEVTHSDDLIRD